MIDCITPDWPAPANITALTTTRSGGTSVPPFHSFNLAAHVGDDQQAVMNNRQLLRQHFALPSEPFWLNQVHANTMARFALQGRIPEADGSYTDNVGEVCAVLTADCLPVLFCDRTGSQVAAAHAGWRGLHNGILEQAVAVFRSAPRDIMAWLGPAIGPETFEVGTEVYQAFTEQSPDSIAAFTRVSTQHWLADIYQLARLRLQACGVEAIFGGGFCTYQDEQRFYSYRRNSQTGRMASLIWIS